LETGSSKLLKFEEQRMVIILVRATILRIIMRSFVAKLSSLKVDKKERSVSTQIIYL